MHYKDYTICALDFETFFDTHYTLKKMDTSLYIQDERFQIYGASFDEVYYEAGPALTQKIKSVNWANTAVLCHNTAFDGFILNYIFKVKPAYYLDTLSMSRPILQNILKSLGLDSIAKHYGFEGKVSDILQRTKGKRHLNDEEKEEMAEYCNQDVNDMVEIFKVMISQLSSFEMDLIDLTIRMFCEPHFVADKKRIQNEIYKIEDEKEQLFSEVKNLLPPEFTEEVIKVLRSGDKFALTLEYNNCRSPTKLSPTTSKTTHAFARTDLDFIELSKHPNPDIRKLYTARLLSKADTAYNKAVKLLNYSQHGAVPAFLNYAKAQTLRWSGKELQMQNMNRGGEMRRSLCAPEGSLILVMDSGQIEARMLAWLAEEEEILDAFRNNEDVYKNMACKIYDKKLKDITKDERFIGKIAILGLGYSMSAPKFQLTLAQGAMGPPVDMELDECKNVVKVYRDANSNIVTLWQRAHRWLHAMASTTGYTEKPYKGMWFERGKLHTHKGMYLNYYDLTYHPENGSFSYQGANGVRRYIYGALLIENIVQHLSRNLIAEQTLNLSKYYPCLLSIHDESVNLIPKIEDRKAMKIAHDIMITPADWCPDLPLSAEGGVAYNYSK